MQQYGALACDVVKRRKRRWIWESVIKSFVTKLALCQQAEKSALWLTPNLLYLENAANNQEDHRRWSVFSRGSDICRIWAEGALFGLAKTTVALFAMSQVRSRKVRHRIIRKLT